ncbi:MAG: membrane protein insertion efficiency factor YidD [Ignavibacteriales bacterium]
MTLAARAVVAVISLYQKALSPYIGRTCRYYPTCSEYMSEAVRKYGAAKGIALGLRRLARCHPFGRGGYDPVP